METNKTNLSQSSQLEAHKNRYGHSNDLRRFFKGARRGISANVGGCIGKISNFVSGKSDLRESYMLNPEAINARNQLGYDSNLTDVYPFWDRDRSMDINSRLALLNSTCRF